MDFKKIAAPLFLTMVVSSAIAENFDYNGVWTLLGGACPATVRITGSAGSYIASLIWQCSAPEAQRIQETGSAHRNADGSLRIFVGNSLRGYRTITAEPDDNNSLSGTMQGGGDSGPGPVMLTR